MSLRKQRVKGQLDPNAKKAKIKKENEIVDVGNIRNEF